MSHKPTATAIVECIRCLKCRRPMKIEILARFECSKCGQVNQVTVATDRVTGPIVWLAGS
jgi:hypothetical protein